MTSTEAEPSHHPSPNPKHISNPRRLLILTPTSQSLSAIPPFLHALTGVPVHDPPLREISTEVDPTVSSPESQLQSQAHPSETAAPVPASVPRSPTTVTSFAGYTTHSPLRLQTKYYTAEVPVWVDEIPIPIPIPGGMSAEVRDTGKDQQETTPTSTQWRIEFLSDEAQIVREAVGAMVVCVQSPAPLFPQVSGSMADAGRDMDPADRGDVRAVRDLMRDVGAVKGCIDEERGGMGDVPGVLVLVGARKAIPSGLGDKDGLEDGLDDVPFSVTWWEDQLFDMGVFGWEVVEWDPAGPDGEKTRNRFGEYEGMPRIKEVLETHDWTALGDFSLNMEDEAELNFDDDFDEFVGVGRSSHTHGFGEEVNELEREMLGLRMAIERGGDGYEEDDEDENDENRVESMETLMMRMQSIRDMSSELPEGERKRFAAKAVQDLMREL